MKCYVYFKTTVILLLAMFFLTFVGCGNTIYSNDKLQTSATESINQTSASTIIQNTTSNTIKNININNLPKCMQYGIVILGTEGCPHCRALKSTAEQLFGKQNVCFKELAPQYGGNKADMDLFIYIMQTAFPTLHEDEYGVPLGILFNKGHIAYIFIGYKDDDILKQYITQMRKTEMGEITPQEEYNIIMKVGKSIMGCQFKP